MSGAGGQTPLVIWTNQTIEKIKCPGPPLGVMEDVPYQEQTVQLEPGDTILLFSDGAFEIHNAKDELLGIDRFVNVLKSLDYPKSELQMDVLREKLLKFSDEIRLQDDITIVEIHLRDQ